MQEPKDNIRVELLQRKQSKTNYGVTNNEVVISHYIANHFVTKMELTTNEARYLADELKKVTASFGLTPKQPGENIKRWLKCQLGDSLLEERYNDSEAIRYIIKCVDNWERHTNKPIANIETEQLVSEVVNEL